MTKRTALRIVLTILGTTLALIAVAAWLWWFTAWPVF